MVAMELALSQLNPVYMQEGCGGEKSFTPSAPLLNTVDQCCDCRTTSSLHSNGPCGEIGIGFHLLGRGVCREHLECTQHTLD